MNNIEALQLLKSLLEIYGSSHNNSFNEILLPLKKQIAEPQIINEIERNNFGEVLILVDKYLFEKTNFKRYYFLNDLERFDFDIEENLTIEDVKKLLHITLLQFKTVNDTFGNLATYCQHWDNQRRVNVRIERELMNRLKADKSILLTLKKQAISANLGYYYRFTIKEYFQPRTDNFDEPDYAYQSSYEKYGGYNGYDDDAIDYAFEGDPSNTWNVD
jgi:hypothetical protein